VKIGGRGQWRIEQARLEEWISGSTATQNGFSTSTPLTGTGDKRTSDQPPGS